MSEEGAAPSAEVIVKSAPLRDLRGGAAPRVEALEAAPEPAPVVEEAAPAAPEPPPLDPAELEALSGDLSKPPVDTETVMIGDAEIPMSALLAHLGGEDGDAVLAKIMRTVRAAGEDREVSLLDALKAVPKAEGWQKRQWQAAQAEKKLDGIAASMGADVVGAYQQLHGCTAEQAREAVLSQLEGQYAREAMSPEDRARSDAHAKLERDAAELAQIKGQQKAEQASKDQKAFERRVKPLMYAALKEAGIPKTRQAIQQMAGIVAAMHDQGLIVGDAQAGPEHFASAAETLNQERAEERTIRYDGLEGDALIERMGPELARRAAKAVAKAYQRRAPVRVASTSTKAPASSARVEEESMGAWKRRKDKEMQGR